MQNNCNGKKIYLGAQIPGPQIWNDQGFWDYITFYLLHRRKLEEYQKALVSTQSNTNEANSDSDKEERKGEGKGLMQGLMKKWEVLFDANRNSRVDEDALKTLIMDEINTYFEKIQLTNTIRSVVLVNVAQK